MTITLSSASGPEGVKTWTVPNEFRTKNDAKMAVLYMASWDAVNFLRFRGQSPPNASIPVPSLSTHGADKERKKKRKRGGKVKGDNDGDSTGWEDGNVPDAPLLKMRKVATSGAVKLGFPMLETKEEAAARQRAFRGKASLPRHPQQYKRQSYASNPSSRASSSKLRDVSAAAAAVIEQIEGQASAAYSLPPPPPIAYDYRPAPEPLTGWHQAYNRPPYDHYHVRHPSYSLPPSQPHSFAHEPHVPSYPHPLPYNGLGTMPYPPPDWRPEYPIYTPQNAEHQRPPYLHQDWRHSPTAMAPIPPYARP